MNHFPHMTPEGMLYFDRSGEQHASRKSVFGTGRKMEDVLRGTELLFAQRNHAAYFQDLDAAERRKAEKAGKDAR